MNSRGKSTLRDSKMAVQLVFRVFLIGRLRFSSVLPLIHRLLLVLLLLLPSSPGGVSIALFISLSLSPVCSLNALLPGVRRALESLLPQSVGFDAGQERLGQPRHHTQQVRRRELRLRSRIRSSKIWRLEKERKKKNPPQQNIARAKNKRNNRERKRRGRASILTQISGGR